MGVPLITGSASHAAAARAFGFKQIRMLIGAGKPLCSFRLLGIPTLVNLIPFGGATLCKPPAALGRWRYLVFAGAGLLVNFAATAVAAGVAAPVQRATVLHAEPWLQAKAEAALKELQH